MDDDGPDDTPDAREHRILVVCSGNTCRSPMAAALLAQRAAMGRARTAVRSAGTEARRGAPASTHACAVMAERGLGVTGHRAVPLDAAQLAWATDVWVMDERQRAHVARRWPATTGGGARLLGDVAGTGESVPDPFGGTMDDYRRTADALAALVDEAWRRMGAGGRR